ncbi:carbohydrate ABC transporter permease [Ruminiclostridium cellobioparum]|jgi:multiple sugar transport system permease protein|uniref:ABC transporter, permease protein n=1 Tax=Ruminiclostridium cellobioparum subsp. termitidis CT1112 TaxID=1195236 RepID=S0FRT4_RUMCE|nr:sugar ABC transporter permease [Ruminiclostridium cellobioparum]EMS71208.1 ABC transporter, permease protein [Ruminiclostridium cellobioparum subsp. termitidis CT1112]
MKASKKTVLKRNIDGYAFAAPALIGLFVFTLYPLVCSIFYSFTDWNILSDAKFIGFDNYTKLISDEVFLISLKNTLKWVVIYVPLSLIISFGLALIAELPIKGVNAFRAIFYLPVVCPLIVIALLFTWLYNTEFGLINYGLSLFGIGPVGWLTNPNLAIFSIALMSVWKMAGYNMVVLLAGLQAVPRSVYEASELDGIKSYQKIWFIKLPLIMPAIYFVVVYAIINAFQVFTEIFTMTRGGPGNSTNTLVYYLYTKAFTHNEMGYASAIAIIMAIIIMIVTVLQKYVLGSKVQYET